MNLIIFLVVLSILVIVHEWGHFIAAKSLGVRVLKFSVGFGPKLFSRMHNGTEFMVCAIPLGGYVKMAGDERSECKGTRDEFYAHPVGHRAIIVLMGPMVNFAFALLCFYFTFLVGFPTLAPKIGKMMENYPAATAGLQVGDQVMQIDAKRIDNWDDLQQYVTTSQGQSLHFIIRRNGQTIEKDIVPEAKTGTNIFGQEESIRVIGIQPYEEVVFVKYGPGQALVKSVDQLVNVTVLTFKALYHVITGTMPAKDAFGGPIRIFDVIKGAAALGISYLVFIMAVISANLAIFNLFPIPILDGGHLLLQGIEKLRGRPLSVKAEEGLTKAGLALLLTLMVFVFYNDMEQAGWLQNIRGFWQKFTS
jgi:regulator of sigma E protease